ncbi:virulence factor [Caulobacter sp. S45]|uniref:virulence factor n=1 Tax=Caulobacter sp. S45 TaxID=1641861 RepID=UPI001577325F|nr:virulence factor [Caulobacter sp. S45]
MYAIAFDLNLRTLEAVHPKGFQQAYRDVERTLHALSFRRVQQSVYVTNQHDLGLVYRAIDDLRALNWFAEAVTDIRAFRVEDWSDLTPIFKETLR